MSAHRSRRRPIALAAAVATATALGATALVITPAAAAPAPLKDYKLTWGIKESYRTYVTGIAAGKVTVADGAEQAANNGAFTFTAGEGTYDTDTHAVALAFKGSVQFTSTAHGFDVKLSDFKFNSGTSTVTADVTKSGKTEDDVPFASVTVDRAMTNMTTKLTAEADTALGGGGRYTGAAGDPLTVTAPAPETTPSPTPSVTPPAPSKTPTTKPSATASATPTTAPGTVVDGKLSWGVKESFRTYILSGGEIKLASGVKKNANGFDFPLAKATADSAKKTVNASFGGSVQFVYKAHGLDIKLSDVRIAANGTKGTLSADVTTPKGTNQDVKFASLDLSKASYTAVKDVIQLKNVPAKFTAAGAAQFANDTTGSIYKAGDAIDPVTVALTLSEDATLPQGGTTATATPTTGSSTTGGAGTVGGSGELAETGAETPAGALLGAAGAIAAAGAGVVLATRRRRTNA
ncbi:HtaA domain-containing protein [Streptomyces sp. NBC_01465]|uniref:HtaA domain-containing protein n=1 Tax=Streptomyces sp. NBC_01465 TaxID=2903878 RepID=UPI002E342E38|nr:HtaA domain-containing protein [Streptomyces sp. NBC_01465]